MNQPINISSNVVDKTGRNKYELYKSIKIDIVNKITEEDYNSICNLKNYRNIKNCIFKLVGIHLELENNKK